MKEVLYDINDLTFCYHLGSVKVNALRNIDTKIFKGDMVALMGPSGSGKSTLLNLMGLIEPITNGDIVLQQRSLKALTEGQKNHVRRYDIGFIFQSFLLFDALSVRENIEYFLLKQKLPTKERRERIQKVLQEVGLTAKSSAFPLELSGGQRQRVAIARALAKKPRVILADEPTANLDQATARDILGILRTLTAEGNTVVMASHDPLAREFCSRTLSLHDGRLAKED